MAIDSRTYFGEEPKLFRDPVYGEDIRISPWELRIINTTAFQRLRGIKQLGPCETVWHCATHTRFQHSLGTLHIAEKILNQIDSPAGTLDYARRIVTRLFALLHDIGHLPFGHTIEDERPVLLQRHIDRGRIQALFRPEIDGILKLLEAEFSPPQLEAAGIGSSIGENKGKRRIGSLSDLLIELIAECKGETDEGVPHVPAKLSLYNEIVGNTVCADLLDYLRRDTYHTGLRRQYDDRIISDLHLDGDQLYLDVLPPKARAGSRTELVNLLHVRHSLTERVYYNKTKCWAAAMISKAVELAALPPEFLYDLRDDELLGLLEHAENSPACLPPEQPRPAYGGPNLDALASDSGWGAGSERLWRRGWEQFRDKVGRDLKGAAELVRAYRRRFIFRPAFPLLGDEKLWRDTLKAHFHSCKAQSFRLAMESFIAALAGLEPWQVIICCPNPKMNLKYANPRVGPFFEGDRYRPLDAVGDRVSDASVRALVQASHRVGESHRELWRFDVIVPEDLGDHARGLVKEICQATFGRTDEGAPDGECDGLYRICVRNAAAALRQHTGSEPMMSDVEQLIDSSFKDEKGRETMRPLLPSEFLEFLRATRPVDRGDASPPQRDAPLFGEQA